MSDKDLYAEFGDSLTTNSKVRDSPLSMAHKAALWALISRARVIVDVGWIAWPSIATLATDASMSRAKAAEVLSDLRTWKLIVPRKDESHPSTTYVIDFLVIQRLKPRKSGEPDFVGPSEYKKRERRALKAKKGATVRQ